MASLRILLTLTVLVGAAVAAPLGDAQVPGSSKLDVAGTGRAAGSPQDAEVDIAIPDGLEGQEGHDGDHQQDDAEVISRAKAFDIDCRIVAKRFNWDIQATRKHMKNQARFGRLVAFMERRFANKFAGSSFSRTPGAPTGVWIKGDVPQRVVDSTSQFTKETGLRVELHGGMRFSLYDQDRRMHEVAELLRGKGFGNVGGAVRAGDLIQITLPASAKFPATRAPKEGQELPTEVFSAAKDLLPGYDAHGVAIVFTDDVIDQDEHAYGGRKVYADDTDGDGLVAVCTSAFSVYRVSDGKNGVATAAHCTGMVNFDAVSPESDFDLYHKGEHRGAYGDMEWKTSDHYEIAEYYAEPGSSRRDVTSVTQSFSENDVVCVYSRVQGERNCEYVYSVNISQGGDDKLIAVDSHVTTGGDSGGPWSYGTEASGVHKGYKTIWFKKRSTFSKAKLLNSALGVKVLLK